MRYVFPLDHPHELSFEAVTRLVGGKAANLGLMARDLGLPVPPGFVITTDACRAFLDAGWPDELDGQVHEAMTALESGLGRRFGDPADPLLVSVRSGAPVSMPGMMDTILDLGLNARTTEGLAHASGDEGFAADCARRFAAQFHDIVGTEPPQDPWGQLRLAIEAVFGSWNSDRARAYRARERLPDDTGTGVTVQAMVFGNRGPSSATGVVFTRNPATGEPGLYGDILFSAQGEDVVAGTHATEPIAALDDRLPGAGAELRRHAATLERHFRDLCDIEFTIEDGRLWLLQVRIGKRSPRAALRIALDMAADPAFPLSRAEAIERVAAILADPPTVVSREVGGGEPIATGLAASPGLASGAIETTADAAERAAVGGRDVILVRSETSPEDVHGMAVARGILTARGGLASHAAVVARGWGIAAVVGAPAVVVGDGEVRIGDRHFRHGDQITIDGGSGHVFEGRLAVRTEVAPEAEALLEWAGELGIEIPAGASGNGRESASSERLDSEAADTDPSSHEVTTDDCIRALGIKGFATAAMVGDAVLATPEVVEPVLRSLVESGAATAVADAYRLTEAGRSLAEALLEADRRAWGSEAATAALDRFLALDGQMKEAVTAWQLRPGDGEPVPNDHGDAAYDRGVIERLAAISEDARAFLAPLEAACPRLAAYRERLGRALGRAADDGRYIASPRVDSIHGVWFELHEDLIQLAGRTRADEVNAGRA